MLDDGDCPQWAQESLDRYTEHGIPTGDCLRAVLANDMMAAFARADANTSRWMAGIVGYVSIHVPPQARGSYEHVDEWIAQHLRAVRTAGAADKPKILVFCNNGRCDGTIEGSPGLDWHNFTAIAEDGEVLAGHVCSHHGFARHDMGVSENGWKRETYAKKYPDGFEVELVAANDPRLDSRFELNKKRVEQTDAARQEAGL